MKKRLQGTTKYKTAEGRKVDKLINVGLEICGYRTRGYHSLGPERWLYHLGETPRSRVSHWRLYRWRV